MTHKRYVLFVLAPLLFARVLLAQETPAGGTSAQTPTAAQGYAEGHPVEMGRPQHMTPKLMRRPPPIRPDQRRRLERALEQERSGRPTPPTPTGPTPYAPPEEKTQTQPNIKPTIELRIPKPLPREDPPSSALVTFLGNAIGPPGIGGGTSVNEPSLAQSGKNVLYVGNWYVAHSTNGGLNWSFINPFADMPDFCCDQEAIYDRGRDLFLWYRQGVRDNSGKNRFRLGVSTDGGTTWCTYSVRPSNLNGSWTQDQAFDFPQLALSNNYVYIHTGLDGAGVPSTAVMRFPLDELASCSAFSFWWWGQVSYWGGPVQGATTAMYYGDHQGLPNSFRIYQQPENTTNILWTDVAIPGWQLEQGEPDGACPSADRLNWCVRSDSVVRGGWVANGILGFMWHARAGNGFPFPYVEAATFREASNFPYLGRPFIWSNNGAWHYPYVSPNARGDIAATAFFSTAASFPSPAFLISDDYTPHPPPGWEAYLLTNGGKGAVGWGDYVRNRTFQPSQLGWASSAWVNVGGPQGGIWPLFYIVGRQRDIPSINRVWQK